MIQALTIQWYTIFHRTPGPAPDEWLLVNEPFFNIFFNPHCSACALNALLHRCQTLLCQQNYSGSFSRAQSCSVQRWRRWPLSSPAERWTPADTQIKQVFCSRASCKVSYEALVPRVGSQPRYPTVRARMGEGDTSAVLQRRTLPWCLGRVVRIQLREADGEPSFP